MILFLSIKNAIVILYSWLVKRPKEFLQLISHKELYHADSYYPEFADRSRSNKQIFFDQCQSILKYGTPNKYYLSYGLDVKPPKEQSEYAHFDTFFRRICELNQSPKINCCCILRDKILFNVFANGIGIETPKNVLYSANGKLYVYETRKEIIAQQLLELGNQSLFCKEVDGECGRGIDP